MKALDEKLIILGVTGGIAAYKSGLLARALVRAGARVTVVMSEAATRFVAPLTFEALTGNPCLTDASMFEQGAAISHVELARKADCIVIAPATANTIAKISHGFADTLLTTTVLASSAPVLMVPSMHTGMWENELTQGNLDGLPSRFTVMAPDVGVLASGDKGAGRFPDEDSIVWEAAALLAGQDFEDRTVVVTGGPTREHLDPVRVFTNPSTGRMGIAVAMAAQVRGARVRLVLGPTQVEPPRRITGRSMDVVRVETASEMLRAVDEALEGADALVMAAAVADERPVAPSAEKVRKGDLPSSVKLERTPDILMSLANGLGDIVTLGFAAETGDLEAAGRAKLEAKGLDLIFANPVGGGRGFASSVNEGILLGRDGFSLPVGSMAKQDLADLLLDHVAALMPGLGTDS
ncbi:MAG: bifunctional phosphopantothenoylcysteine decarboxylase/phosphopantothenate--cysteine ligase CoaBC [Deltaproteobacteria bacterium]|nr:bifunctional phosphopantothenoylcysteine decarboxylase/phosphopantothenate--cysteine ligase CoaBC [Deltaproteobacteria bacterium]